MGKTECIFWGIVLFITAVILSAVTDTYWWIPVSLTAGWLLGSGFGAKKPRRDW